MSNSSPPRRLGRAIPSATADPSSHTLEHDSTAPETPVSVRIRLDITLPESDPRLPEVRSTVSALRALLGSAPETYPRPAKAGRPATHQITVHFPGGLSGEYSTWREAAEAVGTTRDSLYVRARQAAASARADWQAQPFEFWYKSGTYRISVSPIP